MNINIIKKGFVGFSWTTLFFTFWVPLFRGDYAWFGIGLVVALLSIFLAFIPNLIYGIIMAFIYNKIYTKNLMTKEGFQPVDDEGKALLKKYEIIYS